MDSLLGCPFCGAAPVIVRIPLEPIAGNNVVRIHCPDCRFQLARGGWDQTVVEVDTVKMWNRRTHATRLTEAVRALYYAAHWTPDRDVDAYALWTAVRDAAGFEPGESPEPLTPESGV